jgi:Uma2 family endonuclease
MSRTFKPRSPRLQSLKEEISYGLESEVLSFDSRSIAPATWARLEAFLEERGDVSGRNVTWLDGVLEVLVPGHTHELVKKNLARLIELWALELDVELNATGSVLIKNKRKRAALEPDESYTVGPLGKRQIPDIAVEVVWTRGAVDKLEAYRRLGVKEVWVWEHGALEAFINTGTAWKRRANSELLPSLDFKLLSRFSVVEDQHRALKQFRALIARSVH